MFPDTLPTAQLDPWRRRWRMASDSAIFPNKAPSLRRGKHLPPPVCLIIGLVGHTWPRPSRSDRRPVDNQPDCGVLWEPAAPKVWRLVGSNVASCG